MRAAGRPSVWSRVSFSLSLSHLTKTKALTQRRLHLVYGPFWSGIPPSAHLHTHPLSTTTVVVLVLDLQHFCSTGTILLEQCTSTKMHEVLKYYCSTSELADQVHALTDPNEPGRVLVGSSVVRFGRSTSGHCRRIADITARIRICRQSKDL
jgi:hypothetical protein